MSWFRDILAIVGAYLLIHGLGMISPALATIVAGILILGAAIIASMRRQEGKQ